MKTAHIWDDNFYLATNLNTSFHLTRKLPREDDKVTKIK